MIFPRMIAIAQAGPMTDAPPLTALLTNVMSFLISIFGAIAVLMVIVGGVMYITAAGDSQRAKLAKKTILGAVIGVIVALMAWVIVNTIITLV